MVERTLHQFDRSGRLLQWPAKRSVQTLALWAMWAVLPSETSLSERVVNDILNREHLFGDPATLRRTMISSALLTRHRDGTDYRRIEQKPPIEASTVIRMVSARRKQRESKRQETAHA